MTLTLEEIIVKGLDEKLRETNYRSKIYGNVATPTTTSQSGVAFDLLSKPDVTFTVPESKCDEKNRHRSQDSNSPGDSDYESAQVYIKGCTIAMRLKHITLNHQHLI
jgi:hypothetical protein